MARFNVIELEDQRWFPSPLRNCMTDLLNFIITGFRIYDPIVPILYKALRKSKAHEILDLCSGGAGAICRVQNLLEHKFKYPVTINLSDLYPNENSRERIKKIIHNKIAYLPDAVNAMHIPAELEGFRTLFTCFHHFDPESARKILGDAVSKGRGIAVFELSERTLRGALGPLCLPLLVMVLTPFLKPFSWFRLFFTYIIPAIPIAFIFDGIMSQLRSYTHQEMLLLAREVDDGTYTWESGIAKHRFLPFRLNYLVGYKAEDKA